MERPFFSNAEWRALMASLRRGLAIGLAVVGGVLSLSLVSYSPTDPGVYTATWREAANWLGAGGAYLSDLLFRTLGFASFALVAILLTWAIRLHRDKNWSIEPPALVATPFAVFAAAAVASSHGGAMSFGGGYGGMLGDLIFGVLAKSLPFAGPKTQLVVGGLLSALLFAASFAFALGWTRREFHALAVDAQAHWRRIMSWRAAAPRAATAGAAATPRQAPDRRPTESATLLRSAPPRRPTLPPAPRDDDRRTEPSFSTPPAPKPAPAPLAPARSAPLLSPAPIVAAAPPSAALAPEPAAEPVAPALPEATPRPIAAARTDAPRPALAPTPEAAPVVAVELPAIVAERFADASIAEDAPIEEASIEEDAPQGYAPPPLTLLDLPPARGDVSLSEKVLAEQADRLQAVLNDYGVRGQIIDVNPGPVVSQFELEPAPGLKASRVIGLADDIARSMSAVAARVSTIPGRNIIGVELPNEKREMVMLRPLLEDMSFTDTRAKLPLALGRDIAGAPVVADLAAMPHLLIAGTTGSGKSVAINTMILSLLYKLTPEECRLILIDPKMLELSVYNDTPHLLAPVVTDPKKAVAALRWAVREMERRYHLMAQLNVRSLDSFNEKIADAAAKGEVLERAQLVGVDPDSSEPIYEMRPLALEKLPMLVVVIDEMADLMLVAGKEIELCIQRLAQMARASGIHLIMATQRPSVDVITGVIKANFPIRISFQVTSKIDSRTILSEAGAEQLLGKGDMLFTAGGGRLQRIHGPFASDLDVEAVAAYLRAQGPAADLIAFDEPESSAADIAADEDDGTGDGASDEALYQRALRVVARERRASTSFLQRRLQLGYNRAARIVEMMEQNGAVSAANHVGKREVLIEHVD